MSAPPARRDADKDSSPSFAAVLGEENLFGWEVPEGDIGHWKVAEGVIDYDAEGQAKSLWTRGAFVPGRAWRATG